MEHSKRWNRHIQCFHQRRLNLYSSCIWHLCIKVDDQQRNLYPKYSRCNGELLCKPDNSKRWLNAELLCNPYQRRIRWQHPNCRYRSMEYCQRRDRNIYGTNIRQFQLCSQCIRNLCIALDHQQRNMCSKHSRYYG